MKQLIAYHGKAAEKAAILKQLRAHRAADEIVQGISWEHGKGCAVGCTLHNYNHGLYETRFGIPEMLARLEDCIFEGLKPSEAKNWPIQFMSAIKPGTDLSLVGWKFLHWLLTNKSVNPGIDHPLVREAVKQCADALVPLCKGGKAAASAAWSAACSAARSAAESAAWSAARSAAWSAARSAAWSAACSAAESAAWSAAWSAGSAAESAAWSAGSAAYSKMAAKLISLLKECRSCEN